MCARQGRHLQDCEKICDVFWNIGEDRKKNIGRTRRSKPQEMAGDSRGNYGGRFAGRLWREIRGEIMAGRLEVNPNTAVNDAEQ